MTSTNHPVSLSASLASFRQLWSPRLVGSVNDYDIRLAHVDGEHVWHRHPDTDEFFMVIEGSLRIHLDPGDAPAGHVDLAPGEFYVVPLGVLHKLEAQQQSSIMMFEPTGTSSVGDAAHETVPAYVDITAGHKLTAGRSDES